MPWPRRGCGGKPSTGGNAPPKSIPTYAQAFNNLAIAHEHEGELDKARAAYEKALQIEPTNALIKQNYDLFKEINDRTGRKDGR